MILKIFAAVLTFAYVDISSNYAATDQKHIFSEENWKKIPCPLGNLNCINVTSINNKATINGYEWSINRPAALEPLDLPDGDFRLYFLYDPDMYVHLSFSIDSTGLLRYSGFLSSEGDEVSLAASYPCTLTIQLTPDVLANPIIQKMQHDISFKEILSLRTSDPIRFQQYKRKNALNLAMFFRSEYRDDILNLLN